MSGILKSKSTVYEFNLVDLRNLIAEDLMVHVDKIKIEFVTHVVGADPMDRFPGRTEVKAIKVTVEE